jgi:hypothetical protein
MRLSALRLAAISGFAALCAACMNFTGDQTIADYCADPMRTDYDICKQHRDVEAVGMRADRAQATADAAMARDFNCTTEVVQRSKTGSCSKPGYVLTSCVQTRFTRRAGGLAILRSIDNSECRFSARVLEMNVRCCRVGSGE